VKKDLLAYFALSAICVIWGTTYLALRVAVVGFPPFLFVVIRQLIAGGLLVTVVSQSFPRSVKYGSRQ
jgi:drug/metabolite transporter (DMT)-like permease